MALGVVTRVAVFTGDLETDTACFDAGWWWLHLVRTREEGRKGGGRTARSCCRKTLHGTLNRGFRLEKELSRSRDVIIERD